MTSAQECDATSAPPTDDAQSNRRDLTRGSDDCLARRVFARIRFDQREKSRREWIRTKHDFQRGIIADPRW